MTADQPINAGSDPGADSDPDNAGDHAADNDADIDSINGLLGDPVDNERTPAEFGETRHRPWWHAALRILGLAVVATIVVSLLQGDLPAPKDIWSAILRASGWWVAAAAGLQAVSIGMFIRQQRRLLHAFGIPVSYARVGAITYSATALANSLPAGAAVSAGWSFRQFRRLGASSSTAATVMLLSGLLSVGALVVLYLIGLVVAAWTTLGRFADLHPGATALIGILVLIVVVGLIVYVAEREHTPGQQTVTTPRLDRFQADHARLGMAARQVNTTMHQAARIRWRDWNAVIGTSAAKWILDAACLYASCRAFDIRIDLFQLAAIYLSLQLVRQIPLTPGGIGVIEVALLAALVSAGASSGPAAAAVIVYRLLSAWAIIPLGFAIMGLLARWDRSHPQGPSTLDPAAD